MTDYREKAKEYWLKKAENCFRYSSFASDHDSAGKYYIKAGKLDKAKECFLKAIDGYLQTENYSFDIDIAKCYEKLAEIEDKLNKKEFEDKYKINGDNFVRGYIKNDGNYCIEHMLLVDGNNKVIGDKND